MKPTQNGDDLVIDLARVEKTFKGRVRALDDVQMRVHRGEVFGLLGPNGAGKSTLVKILLTIVRPSRCQGRMLGEAVGDKSVLSRVGYLPEHLRFPQYLTGGQSLEYSAALSNVPRRERKQRREALLERVGMTRWANKKVGGYSKGMRQRLGVAQALMNDPDLVFLDEPTDGLDPVGRRDVRRLLVELREEGKTVFINSHLLNELEAVCDRVAILAQGRLVLQGTMDELTAGQERYTIELASAPAPAALAAAREAAEQAGVSLEIKGDVVQLGVDELNHAQLVMDALRSQRAVIKSARPTRPSLEDLFMRAIIDPHTGEELLPGAASPGSKQETSINGEEAP